MLKKIFVKLKDMVSKLDVVKKFKFNLSFIESAKNMRARNYRMEEIDVTKINKDGIIIITDHDYVRSKKRLLGFAEFYTVSRNEKYTVLYVDNDFHKLNKMGQKFIIEQELSKIINLVDRYGGNYNYVNSTMVFNYNDTNKIDITTVKEMGIDDFIEGMDNVANFMNLKEFYCDCTYRANNVITYLTEVKYRQVGRLTGREIVNSLLDAYGEGLYNMISRQTVQALCKVVL